ncbi:MAG: outer membrane beta-barrel protein [Endomicrobiaceae bacterium]|nr:outer membrane beta-barrel protein [Endomicrobiaceae bacterium]MDD3729926.1 outer membrane beta-barrel protein [Endomicrobiaceae bacterium]
MKKSILSVLLMLVLALPVLASEKGAMEADAKLGIGLNSTIKPDGVSSMDLETSFGLGGDFYYYVDPAIALGAGLMYGLETAMKDDSDLKVGFTNIYFAAKPTMALDSEIFSCIYGLIQIGYGMPRATDIDDIKGGLYWGIGAGTEIKSFIVELIYGSNAGEGNGDKFTATSINLNLGYKFAL